MQGIEWENGAWNENFNMYSVPAKIFNLNFYSEFFSNMNVYRDSYP